MFFENLGPIKKKVQLKLPPKAADTGWRAPESFPNLSDAKVISFDLERREDDFDNGPGWRRGKASTCGFSLGAIDRLGNKGAWYFPIRHAVDQHLNLNPDQALTYLRSVLQTPHIPKVGANLIYDIGSLTDDGIYVQGPLHDIQFAEALLHSDGEVNLEHLARKYLGRGKESNRLYELCAQAYGGKANNKQRANIWRMSPLIVGPYGESDAALPLDIIDAQYPLLYREEQHELYRMECDLIQLLVRMRLAGVRVNVDKAERLYAKLGNDLKHQYAQFKREYVEIESVQSGKDIQRCFDHIGLQYPKTAEGNPSFRKDFLKNLDHPLADLINTTREMEKIRGTFIRNYILEKNVNGQLFCSFNPLRGDDGGTVTGRFSSSDPNLQNIPVRTDLGKQMRDFFEHDLGHACIEKDDMSQQEYRDLAHFAVDDGDGSAQALRDDYNNNPKTDYHVRVRVMIKERAHKDIERRPIKNINFGLLYGMSEKKLNRMNGFSPSEGKSVFKAYHESNPYVKATMKAAEAEMQEQGFITTILGRRIRFNLWEPIFTNYGEDRSPGLPFEMAINEYGPMIKRSGGHKAINYRLQGSNADQIKKGMVDCHKAGVYEVCGVPRLQVHDELVHSLPDLSPAVNEALNEMRHILETCIPHMRVPVRIDHKRGPTWGACE